MGCLAGPYSEKGEGGYPGQQQPRRSNPVRFDLKFALFVAGQLKLPEPHKTVQF